MISPLLLLQDAPAKVPEAHTRMPEMSTGSWIFMLAAWLFVTLLLAWSFKRVLSEPSEAPEPPIAGPPGA